MFEIEAALWLPYVYWLKLMHAHTEFVDDMLG